MSLAACAWVIISCSSMGTLAAVLFLLQRTRKSDARFRLLAENSSDLIAIHSLDGSFVWVSPSIERLLGYTPREILGVFPHTLIHPDDLPGTDRPFQPVEEPTRITYRIRKKDGTYLWFETVIQPIYSPRGEMTQLQTASRDVSEQEEAKQLYRFLIRHLPNISVFLFDRHTRHLVADGTLVNQTLHTLDLEGRTLWEVFPDDIAQVLAPFYTSVFSGEPKITEQHFRTNTYRIHFLPIHGATGGIDLAMAVFLDVTEEKARTRVLEDQTQDLERSNRDLEQFANVASHELKAPLRRISGFAELLAAEYEGRLSLEADDYIHHITDGVAALQAVIESLLTYSRVQTKAIRFEWVDTEAVFLAAMGNLAAQVRETRAKVFHKHLPRSVTANETLLRQLFENLIGNAIKFNTTGRSPEVRVSCRRDLLDWEFSVADNGPGIDPEHHNKVFTMFSRLRPEIEGTGIGLALCKKIVGIHRGRIWFDSDPGRGTTFRFTIPARSPDEITQH